MQRQFIKLGKGVIQTFGKKTISTAGKASFSSTHSMGNRLQLHADAKISNWNITLKNLPAPFIKELAPHLLKTTVAISAQQSIQFAELLPKVRVLFFEAWKSLEKYETLDLQQAFNQLIGMVIRENHLLLPPHAPSDLKEQFNMMNSVGLLKEQNFQLMMDNPGKTGTVLQILSTMKKKNMLNGNPEAYQRYLTQLNKLPTPTLKKLNEALAEGPYTTKAQVDILLDKADFLDRLAPVHRILHTQEKLTNENLARTDYYEVAEYIANLLTVPGAPDDTFKILADYPSMTPKIATILDSCKTDVELQRLMLPLLFDHLDEVPEISKKIVHIQAILTHVDSAEREPVLEILLNHLTKIDELDAVIKQNPILLGTMQLETFKILMDRIESMPRTSSEVREEETQSRPFRVG